VSTQERESKRHWIGERLRFDPRVAGDRVVTSTPAILQIVVAVVAAYTISHYLLGHPSPVTAVTVTLSSLGFIRDARPLRVLETALGVTLGIALSEAIVLGFGQGVWQLGLALVVTLFAARFVSPTASFAVVAGVQSVLVAVLPVQAGGPFTRTIDGLVGGAIALAITALVPRDPRRAAIRDGRRFLSSYVSVLTSLAAALRSGDSNEPERILERARRMDPMLDLWRSTLDSAVAITRISPYFHKNLHDLELQQSALKSVDLAMRNLRVVTRRLTVLERDGRARPEIAEFLSDVSSGVTLLGQSLSDSSLRPAVRQSLILSAVRLDPGVLLPGQPASEASVVFALRPMVMDLLCAAGLSTAEARAAMPEITR
jgi:uncharacterized membrane protein YgaE (UPF0421/DUF939 family)